MKTKKIVVGTMTAALLSLMVSSLPVTFAAGETVQISVGSDTAEPGGEFSVEVSLANIPANGIQACDFAVEYDSSILTVTSVTAGALTETGAAEADPSASQMPNFDYEIVNDEGTVNLLWTTSLDDASYWLQDGGVFCTITGTVSESAAEGTSAELKAVATSRDTYPNSGTANSSINAGYSEGTSAVKYEVSVTDGAVTIGSGATSGTVLYGDADCSGTVDIADVVLVMGYASNKEKNPISAQGLNNADVYQRGDGVGASDALAIQKKLAQIITELPES